MIDRSLVPSSVFTNVVPPSEGNKRSKNWHWNLLGTDERGTNNTCRVYVLYSALYCATTMLCMCVWARIVVGWINPSLFVSVDQANSKILPSFVTPMFFSDAISILFPCCHEKINSEMCIVITGIIPTLQKKNQTFPHFFSHCKSGTAKTITSTDPSAN